MTGKHGARRLEWLEDAGYRLGGVAPAHVAGDAIVHLAVVDDHKTQGYELLPVCAIAGTATLAPDKPVGCLLCRVFQREPAAWADRAAAAYIPLDDPEVTW